MALRWHSLSTQFVVAPTPNTLTMLDCDSVHADSRIDSKLETLLG